MESLIREANTQKELKELDFERLREFYQNSQREPLTKKNARELLAFLLSKTGEKTDSPVQKELRPKAKAALGVLMYFLMEDEMFQHEFERYSSRTLASKLKLERHLLEGPEEHRRTVIRLLKVIMDKFPKFANWRLLVRPQAHSYVLRGLAELEMAGGVTSSLPTLEKRLPPPGCYNEQEAQEVINIFNVKPDMGLTTEEAAARRTRYGFNALPRQPPPSILKLLYFQITDFMVMILSIVAGIELGLQEWAAAAVLGLVVFFNVLVGFMQELKAQRALRALETLQVPKAQVMRDGEQKMVSAEELVPGDIVLLDEGCQVPADLRLYEAVNLHVLEALLTGEAEPIEKHTKSLQQRHLALGDMRNCAFMSTSVVRGRGCGVVTATGKTTEVGKISKALAKKDDNQTILQQKLRVLGKALVAIAVILCAIVVAISLLRLGLAHLLDKTAVRETIELGVSLGVSVIPEGLIAVVTITMALGVQRMAAKNAIVKRLASVESLGSITTICSDKTGTLTEGKMKAEELRVDPEFCSDDLLRAAMCCSLCNNSAINYDDVKGVWEPTGDPTEVAILIAGEKLNRGKSFWQSFGWEFVDEVPFDSDRKCMSVLYRLSKPGAAGIPGDGTANSPDGAGQAGRGIMLAKGAPEAMIKRCTHAVIRNGGRAPLDADILADIDKTALEMASRGLRVLGLAYRAFPVSPAKEQYEKLEMLETELVFVGLIGLIDPPRMEVRDAIERCKDAGIRVCMITGDHPLTAYAIAVQLGIAEKGEEEQSLLKGADIDAVSDSNIDLLADLNPFPSVFARVSPQHKLKIVQALKMRNEICAMTGDGVNDAPAIKSAHVGVAMGKTGTDLTKDAADVILMDDNFSTIVAAIREGRQIYDNIKKFILYLLSCNSSEIYVVLFCAIVGLEPPFTPIMILWVNLVADIPPALSLGVDPQERDIMTRLPRDPRRGIFNWKTVVLLLYQGMSMSSFTVLLYWLCLKYEEPEANVPNQQEPSTSEGRDGLMRARTLCLVSLTFMQLVHGFLSRSVKNSVFNRGIFDNRWLVGGISLSAVLMVCGMYIPGVNTQLDQVPLPAIDWAKIAGVCAAHTALVELYKLALRVSSNRTRRINVNGRAQFYDEV
eukprot:m51a1_g10998 hypothetical protein (1120) ;mRNA; f:347807-351840